jgi:hypothetical protein
MSQRGCCYVIGVESYIQVSVELLIQNVVCGVSGAKEGLGWKGKVEVH